MPRLQATNLTPGGRKNGNDNKDALDIAKDNLYKEQDRQYKESMSQSLGHSLSRLNPFSGVLDDDVKNQERINHLEHQVKIAGINVRSKAGNNSHVNPINGPIAGTHKKAGK